MKRLLPLLALLLLPAAAWGQHEFSLSCANVTRIVVVRMDARYWKGPSEDGQFHVLFLWLTPEAGKDLAALRKSLPQGGGSYTGEIWRPVNIYFRTGKTLLQGDAPEWNNLGEGGVSIPIVREQDALEAARRICPALAPDKALTQEQVPWQEYK